MENGGERRAMENGGGTMPRSAATDLVMCSTCSGFVFRKRRTAIPKPGEEVVEVVTEAEKMRDLMKAVLLHGPLQEIEPAAATKKQRQVLRRRRRMLMETKKCPTCYASLSEACPTCFRSLSQKPGPDDEKDKAMVADPRSKAGSEEEKKKSSRQEGSEFMAVLPSQGGKERKNIATEEDEAMLADARSEHKLKRSREEGKTSSSGLKEKKAKRSSEMEGNGLKEAKMKGNGLKEAKMKGNGLKEAKMKGSQLKDEAEIENIESVGGSRKTKMEIGRLLNKAVELLNEDIEFEEEAKMEDSKSAVGDWKTKMVTKRMDKKYIDILKNRPPRKSFIDDLPFVNRRLVDTITAHDKVVSVFLEYLQCQSFIKGYAEYQVEVPDDEGDDHKLV